MPFRFVIGDASVEAGVRRIALEQIDRAIGAIDRQEPATAIHSLRKRCKKLRAMVRLIRPAFPAYAEANATFRDIARMVAPMRDARVMQETHDALLDHYASQLRQRQFRPARRALTQERVTAESNADPRAALQQCRARLDSARRACAEWTVEETGFHALNDGLSATYRGARKAAAKAIGGDDAEAFHDLRKQVKYHGHHCRILRPVWPAELEAREELAQELSEVLGDHHDLAVLGDRLRQRPEDFGDDADIEVIAALARERSDQLAAQAAEMSARLLAEKPRALVGRLEALWHVWAQRD